MGKGGGPQQVEPTEAEIAQAEVDQERWDSYLEKGVPMQNEYIARVTGYNVDGTVADNGVRAPDGSIRMDTTDSRAATGNIVPETATEGGTLKNAMSQLESAGDRAGVAIREGIGQQDAVVQGVSNVTKMGKGIQTDATQAGHQLAGQAHQEASSIAARDQARDQATGGLISDVAGVAGAMYLGSQNRKQPAIPEQQGVIR